MPLSFDLEACFAASQDVASSSSSQKTVLHVDHCVQSLQGGPTVLDINDRPPSPDDDKVSAIDLAQPTRLWISPAIVIHIQPQLSLPVSRLLLSPESPKALSILGHSDQIPTGSVLDPDYTFTGSFREESIHKQLYTESAEETMSRHCLRKGSRFINCQPYLEQKKRKQRQERMNAEFTSWQTCMQEAVRLKETVLKGPARRREVELERGRHIRRVQTKLIAKYTEMERERRSDGRETWDTLTRDRCHRLRLADIEAEERKKALLKSIGIEEENEDPRVVAERRVMFDDLGCWQLRVRQDEDVSRREDAALRRWVRFTEHNDNTIVTHECISGLVEHFSYMSMGSGEIVIRTPG